MTSRIRSQFVAKNPFSRITRSLLLENLFLILNKMAVLAEPQAPPLVQFLIVAALLVRHIQQVAFGVGKLMLAVTAGLQQAQHDGVFRF